MIKSAAIVKTKTLAPWKELRLQKRKLKKANAAERKAIKQIRPSPISTQVIEVPDVIEQIEVDEADIDSPPTREEMLQQAEAIGMKVDKRWSDATLLKHIEESAWATQNDNL
jgi:ABC-type protease/lipase transport system fused ATPase/permease subunit